MIYKAEEAIGFSSMDKLVCYLVDPVRKVVKRDFRDSTIGVLCWSHGDAVQLFESAQEEIIQ